jgi:putative two-component system response regulator
MDRYSILCVDDDPDVLRSIGRILTEAGHECLMATRASEAHRLIAAHRVSVALCDIGLPGESGLDLLASLANHRPAIATVMVTGRDDPQIADTALALGAYGYLTKPFSANDLVIAVSIAARRRTLDEEAADQLERAYLQTVSRLSRAIEYHDGETGAHVERVGQVANSIALELGLSPESAERIRLAAPLHDVGKIAVPSGILRKAGPLTPVERREVERHAEAGRRLLAGSGNELLELAATVAWTHHENWDGSGYPRGLAAEAIPLAGRIVAVADVFDALTSVRPYRPAISEEDAFEHLEAESDRKFDPATIAAFDRVRARGRRRAVAAV